MMSREEMEDSFKRAYDHIGDNLKDLPNWAKWLLRLIDEEERAVKNGSWPREPMLALANMINKEYEVNQPNKHLKLNTSGEDTGQALDEFLAESEAKEKGFDPNDGSDKRS